MHELPNIDELLNFEFSCNFGLLFEAVINNLRNTLLELQSHCKKIGNVKRSKICMKIYRMEAVFGRESEQFYNATRELNFFDDQLLKEKANKYQDFICKNNERPTRAFCLLGKESNVVDDITLIKDENNLPFLNEKARSTYIKGYYSDLYKKRIDNFIKN